MALVPSLDLILVKIVIVVLTFPMTLPSSLTIAAYSSLLGVFALLNLMVILIFDGLSNATAPG